MVKKSKVNVIGSWAFLIGFIAAVIFGAFNRQITQVTGISYTVILWILVLLGMIIGFINVNKKEVSNFLMAALVLVVVSYAGMGILTVIPQIGDILSALLVFFVPTTIIVALRAMFEITKN